MLRRPTGAIPPTDLTSRGSQSIALLSGFVRRLLLDIVALYYMDEMMADCRLCH